MSLNPVINDAVKSLLKVKNFLPTVQEIYPFSSASTSRWQFFQKSPFIDIKTTFGHTLEKQNLRCQSTLIHFRESLKCAYFIYIDSSGDSDKKISNSLLIKIISCKLIC